MRVAANSTGGTGSGGVLIRQKDLSCVSVWVISQLFILTGNLYYARQTAGFLLVSKRVYILQRRLFTIWYSHQLETLPDLAYRSYNMPLEEVQLEFSKSPRWSGRVANCTSLRALAIVSAVSLEEDMCSKCTSSRFTLSLKSWYFTSMFFVFSFRTFLSKVEYSPAYLRKLLKHHLKYWEHAEILTTKMLRAVRMKEQYILVPVTSEIRWSSYCFPDKITFLVFLAVWPLLGPIRIREPWRPPCFSNM